MDVFEFIGRCTVYGGLFIGVSIIILIITGCLIFGGGEDEGE